MVLCCSGKTLVAGGAHPHVETAGRVDDERATRVQLSICVVRILLGRRHCPRNLGKAWGCVRPRSARVIAHVPPPQLQIPTDGIQLHEYLTWPS